MATFHPEQQQTTFLPGEALRDRIASARLNELAEQINRQGAALARDIPPDDTRYTLVKAFLGRIVTTPAGLAALTDERYYVEISIPKPSLLTGEQLIAVPEYQLAGTARTVVASHLAEQGKGTHALEAEQLVLVVGLYSPATSPQWQYVILSGGTFKLTVGTRNGSIAFVDESPVTIIRLEDTPTVTWTHVYDAGVITISAKAVPGDGTFGGFKRITATWKLTFPAAGVSVDSNDHRIPILGLIDGGDWRAKNFIAYLRVSTSAAGIAPGEAIDEGHFFYADLAEETVGIRPGCKNTLEGGYNSHYGTGDGGFDDTDATPIKVRLIKARMVEVNDYYGSSNNTAFFGVVVDYDDNHKLKFAATDYFATDPTPNPDYFLSGQSRYLHATIAVFDESVTTDAAKYADPPVVSSP